MLQNYAVVDKTTQEVINNIMWDGESPLDPNIIETYDLVP